MKRNLLTLMAAGAIVLGGIVMVQAQPGPGGGGGRGHGKRLMLERLPQELNLTSEQQTKVQPIIDQAKPQIATIRREAMQKIKAVMDSTMSQIRPLLTPDQQKKLDDIQKPHQGRMNAHKEPDDTMPE
jgi:Spy/CpxP family protein refolding chaperone